MPPGPEIASSSGVAPESTPQVVLFVEDDVELRECLSMILEAEGYEVRSAADGVEALEILRGLQWPCVVLLDLMMPRMNGWQFLDIKTADPSLAKVPVIVVSAVTQDQRHLSVEAILPKPVDFEVLVNKIRMFCQLPRKR